MRPAEPDLLGFIGEVLPSLVCMCWLYIAVRSRAKWQTEKPHKVFTELAAFLTAGEQKSTIGEEPRGGGRTRSCGSLFSRGP
jgi:hypothetical protein